MRNEDFSVLLLEWRRLLVDDSERKDLVQFAKEIRDLFTKERTVKCSSGQKEITSNKIKSTIGYWFIINYNLASSTTNNDLSYTFCIKLK